MRDQHPATTPATTAGTTPADGPPAGPASEAAYVTALGILSVSTGVFDAVSYLALDKVFTGNMTGNVLFVAFYLGGDHQLHLLNLAVALGGFLLGAGLVGAILRTAKPAERVPRATLAVMGAVILITLTVALTWAVAPASADLTLVLTPCLAVVLGAQAVALRPVGIRDISTVVITTTLATFASEGILSGRRDPLWRRRVVAILTMASGALAGAVLVRRTGGAAAIAVAALIMGAGTAALWWAARREADPR